MYVPIYCTVDIPTTIDVYYYYSRIYYHILYLVYSRLECVVLRYIYIMFIVVYNLHRLGIHRVCDDNIYAAVLFTYIIMYYQSA